ncbi:hemerythrin domain-containing protein [Tenuifilum osseticum]|uniref:hemerythrin domain-containing protein n=1 Tax=Tenuifilum osseticum TaxID=3374723 RepID=UPI0034E3CF46
MSDLIVENPRLLILLEHFNLDFVVSDKTVSLLCDENSIPLQLFLLFGNLYNGYQPEVSHIGSPEDIKTIIMFLRNSHIYYKEEKYPEILSYIKQIQDKTHNSEIKLIENFFKDYFTEVLEHLDYEETIAFPYIVNLVEQKGKQVNSDFSANEYREHHTDIETKLTDLKNLLLKHIKISNELPLRRKLFLSLFELDFDLQLHAMIEESILLPIVADIESTMRNE